VKGKSAEGNQKSRSLASLGMTIPRGETGPSNDLTLSGERTERGPDEADKVRVIHADGVPVRPGVENDFFVDGQRFVHKDGKTIKFAKRRHGAKLAIGEKTGEFGFAGERNGTTEHAGEFFRFHVIGSGQHNEAVLHS
jgi:hypothetical protein